MHSLSNRFFFTFVFFLLPFQTITDLFAQDSAGDGGGYPSFEEALSEQYGITGNWHDARTYLAEKGATFHGSYVINAASNIGGRSQGATQASSIEADLTLDLDRLFALPYCSLFVSSAFRFGRNLANLRIGNRFSVQQVYGGQTIRLIDLYFSCKVPDAFSLKFGRINTGEDFQSSKLFGQFMSNSFNGNPITPNFNFLFSVFPVSTWGIYFDANIHPQLLWKVGIYNNNEQIFANDTHGTYFRFTPSLGLLLYSEVGFNVEHGPKSSGLYTLGAGYSTGKTNKILKQDVRGNYELYLQIEETIRFGEEEEAPSVAPFFTFLYFPEDRNEFPYFFMVGASAEGLIPSRAKDSWNIGFSQGFFSNDLDTKQTFEGVFEINYKARITSYFYLQPNLQYVLRPSGNRSISDALVFGLQSECVF